MPNTRFNVDITARDRTAEALKSATRGFESLAKHTPLEKISRGFKEFNEKHAAFKEIGKSLLSVNDSAAIAGGGIGEAATGMETLAAMAGFAGIATVGVGAALAGAGTAAFKFADSQTKAGASTAYLAQVIGMSAEQIQQYELAGRKFGVTADAMDAALQGVGNTMQNALKGRDNTAQSLLTQLHVKVKYLADGSIDAAAGMEDLANALANGAHAAGMNNAQTRQLVLGTFSLGGVQAYLVQSLKDRKRALDEATQSGALLTEAQRNQAKDFQQSIAALDDKWDGLLNALSSNIVIPWIQPEIDKLSDFATLLKGITDNKTVEKIGHVAADLATNNGGNLIADLFGHDKTDGTPKGPGPAAGASSRPSAPVSATSRDEDAMARAIYTEADSEGAQGQAAVAHVILNRAKAGYGGAKSIYDVVNAPGQFEGMTTSRKNVSTSDPRYQRALKIAQDVLSGKIADPTGGADHYLNPDLQAQLGRRQPSWAPGNGQRIGRHVFYHAGDTGGPVLASNGPRADLPGSTVSMVGGAVHVDIRMRGAPPGTVVSAQAQGPGVTATARIAPTMQGAA